MNSIYTLLYSFLILIGVLKGGEGESTVTLPLKVIEHSKKHRSFSAEGKALAAAKLVSCGPKCDGSGPTDYFALVKQHTSLSLNQHTSLAAPLISLIQDYIGQHIDLYLNDCIFQAENYGETSKVCVSVPCSEVYSKELSRVPLSGDLFTDRPPDMQAQFYKDKGATKGPASYVDIRICDIRRALYNYAIKVNLTQEELNVYTLTFLSAITTTPYLSLVEKPTCNTYIVCQCIKEYSPITQMHILSSCCLLDPFYNLSPSYKSQFCVTPYDKGYVKKHLKKRTEQLTEAANREYQVYIIPA